jgi:hypothetical protein
MTGITLATGTQCQTRQSMVAFIVITAYVGDKDEAAPSKSPCSDGMAKS